MSLPSDSSDATPAVIAAGFQGVSGLAVDGSNVYISAQSGILKAPLSGTGTATTLINSTVPGGTHGLMVDQSTLYWLTGASINKAGSTAALPGRSSCSI